MDATRNFANIKKKKKTLSYIKVHVINENNLRYLEAIKENNLKTLHPFSLFFS
jgi:hypothetical protein